MSPKHKYANSEQNAKVNEKRVSKSVSRNSKWNSTSFLTAVPKINLFSRSGKTHSTRPLRQGHTVWNVQFFFQITTA